MTFPQFFIANRYALEVEAERDWYLTVLFVQPQKRQCLVVYPNDVQPSALLEKNKKIVLLNDPRVALQPSETNSPEYLYIIATTSPWATETMPQERQGPYRLMRSKEVFQLDREGRPTKVMETTGAALCKQIDSIVVGSGAKPAAPMPSPSGTTGIKDASPTTVSGSTLLTEDVLLFHAFPDKVPPAPPAAEPKRAESKPPA